MRVMEQRSGVNCFLISAISFLFMYGLPRILTFFGFLDYYSTRVWCGQDKGLLLLNICKKLTVADSAGDLRLQKIPCGILPVNGNEK